MLSYVVGIAFLVAFIGGHLVALAILHHKGMLPDQCGRVES